MFKLIGVEDMYDRSKHAVYSLRYHFVFVVKYRKKVFTDEMLDTIYDSFVRIGELIHARIEEFNGEEDHIHFILACSPKSPSVSGIVNILKGVSSRDLRKQFLELRRIYYGPKSKLWSRSYFVSTVGGVTLDVLKRYIENQSRPN